MKTRSAILMAVLVSTATAASAWPVAHYGQNAYKKIRSLADEPGQARVAEHMKRSEKLIYVFYATALLGAAALVSQRKFPKAATPLAAVTLIAAVASLGAGGWISKAGGQIRHPEFRGESASSTNAAPHERSAAKQSHENVMNSRTSTKTQ